MSKGRRHLSHIQRVPGAVDDYVKAQEATLLPRHSVEADQLRGDPEKGPKFRSRGPVGPISRKPHVDALIGSAYITLWAELKRLQDLAEVRTLEEDELRRYSKLVEALARLTKEEREQQRHEKMEDIDDAALLEAADKARELLGRGEDE